ncbi:hypothetical protein CLOBY_30680 [Clostridium saccharobutylicum]|uniref:hypothetical protein n=1 Tax=Clostridium saccharobutylicum TaxID=169679 RepID=UPI000983B7F2|nr:hypothetical protein [Clostridium saccharobutylicum]AQS10919.1 hypothetical protein CLOBY_30680 [Clostridium saccharobutylicum]MBC2436361.1 DUF3800 domain-containing protein [Clostridium saccharobutylicum]NSB88164.1 hypothetical protein [Clostridium saccharobutylicum]NYC31900.1 hypothetical protein [Clostridium saccharobutylicum]OOM17945.1 hypothetical protein CLSAB_11730 [Clostridium saccharobutylicum]
MGKKYIMFVSEKGFLDKDNNFSIAGVVFDQDYCTNVEDKECELSSKVNYSKERILGKNGFEICIDDILLPQNEYKNINNDNKKEFINQMPTLFKKVKTNLILSSIKQSDGLRDDSYNKVVNNLLKNFYSFLIRKKATCGGIVIESKSDKESCIIQQKFFDIYNERRNNLIMTENSQEKINSFIVWEKANKKYGVGIEAANLLNNILYRVSNGLTEVDNSVISYIEYGSENKIFNIIENKIYRDKTIDASNKFSEKDLNTIDVFVNKVEKLKEELELKNIKIGDKEREINKLTQEMRSLKQRLEDAMKSRKNDNIILEILSDIDMKMKGFEMTASAMKS